jgi:hypothetical protein
LNKRFSKLLIFNQFTFKTTGPGREKFKFLFVLPLQLSIVLIGQIFPSTLCTETEVEVDSPKINFRVQEFTKKHKQWMKILGHHENVSKMKNVKLKF